MFRLRYCLFIALFFTSCQKEIGPSAEMRMVPAAVPLPTPEFVSYTIKAGEHFCDKNEFKPVELLAQRFVVRFDSSAIYQTIDPANQDDINKLYGFSDNNAQHHQFSARFGWRWSAGAVRLFGYVYNNGAVTSKQISTVAIGTNADCNLQVTPTHYRFTVDGVTDSLPRLSQTPTAKGYQLYPYFGGDEAAPHDITIFIRNL